MRKTIEFVIDLLCVYSIIMFIYRMKIFDLFGNKVVAIIFAIIIGWILGYYVIPYISKCILDTLIRWHHSTKVE